MNSRILLAFLTLLMNGFVSATESTASRPNIIYLLVDDMGYSDVGFNGCQDIQTPAIDRLAKSGTILSSLYAQPVCSPTRATLMTGRYPVRTGVYQVISKRQNDAWPLPLAERTLANALRDAGYMTAITGKWHLGSAQPEFMPTQRGFDHQYGFMAGSIDAFTLNISEGKDETGRDWYRDDQPSSDQGYDTHLIAKEACRLIRERPADKPFFLYVPFHGVHTAWQSPKEYSAPYQKLDPKRRALAAMTAAVDAAIGQISAAIDEQKLSDNTLIIFSSDNGGPNWDRTSTNKPLRGGKADIYEGGVRVCAFATWPRKIPAGKTVHEPLHMVDWYPTLIKLAGGSTEQKLPLDGLDIWPTLTEDAKSPHSEILLIGSVPGQSAIRMGDWKLLINPVDRLEQGKSKSKNRIELYNLVDDIGEKNNLANTQPERVKEMHEKLLGYLVNPANPGYLKSSPTIDKSDEVGEN